MMAHGTQRKKQSLAPSPTPAIPSRFSSYTLLQRLLCDIKFLLSLMRKLCAAYVVHHLLNNNFVNFPVKNTSIRKVDW